MLRRDAELAERVAAASTVHAEKVFLAALAEELRQEADRLDERPQGDVETGKPVRPTSP